MLSQQELEENLQKIKQNSEKIRIGENLARLDHDLGNQRLAGIEHDDQFIDALKKVAQGKSDISTIRKNLISEHLLKFQHIQQLNLKDLENSLITTNLHSRTYRPVKDRFSFEHFKNIHRDCFNFIDGQAGQVRQRNIGNFTPHFLILNGESQSDLKNNFSSSQKANTTLFDRVKEAWTSKDKNDTLSRKAGIELFNRLKEENYLQGLETDDFVQRLSTYFSDINELHPFEHGNGRTQRTFLSDLAAYNDYSISWQNMSKREMNRALSTDLGTINSLFRSHLIEKDHNAFVSDLSKDVHKDIKIEEVQKNQKMTYQGSIVAYTEKFVIQQQKDKPDHFVLHNRWHLPEMNYQNEILDINYDEHQTPDLIRAEVRDKEKEALFNQLYFENVVDVYHEIEREERRQEYAGDDHEDDYQDYKELEDENYER